LSRRREAGLDSSPIHVFDVLHSPSLGAIIALGVLLMAIFLIWLVVAYALYIVIFSYSAPASIAQFVNDVLTTPRGWRLIIVGTGIGFLFAALVLSISAISFPLLLDRDVGAAVAMHTSLRVMAANPLPMALWGLIVAALLVIGSIPFFVGLTVVMPLLGHATWHCIGVRSNRFPIRTRITSRASVRAVQPPISLSRCCRPIAGVNRTLEKTDNRRPE
jgi:uncharacterized membrane protein